MTRRSRRGGFRVIGPSIRDPRLHVAAVLLTLQVLGQTVLAFRLSVAQILVSLATGALIEFVVALAKDKTIMWPASGMLTGNSTAFILRVPGTLHGDWWSTRGIWIFVGVVAVSMASKYLIRWRGRHIFNPSNLGLVLAFVALGPKFTEPQDLWWIPLGPWLIAVYAILIGGGLLIAWELKLIGLEVAFMAAFAAFLALGLAFVPDHCMVASWHVTPLCGRDLWQVLVTSPELLVFALFMVPDPRTVPDGAVARVLFGVAVALLAVLLLNLTSLEYWTKTAILASLVIACALRFALANLVAPLEIARERLAGLRRLGWRLPVALAIALLAIGSLPVAAAVATYGPEPAAELPDGSTPTVAHTVGAGPAFSGWISSSAGAALPPAGNAVPVSASSPVWILPPIPDVSIPPNVTAFDSSVTPRSAAAMAHAVVLDLVIESEARRTHDVTLAKTGAVDDGLKEFVDVINQDITSGQNVDKTYSFDKVSLGLFLPKYSSQASRLVGVSLTGTTTLIARDSTGRLLSQTTIPYSKSWGLTAGPNGGSDVIVNNFTDLSPAP